MASIAKLIRDGNIEKIDKLPNLQKLIRGTLTGEFKTNSFTFTNPSMLQLAAAYHKYEVVEYLLKWGCDPNQFNILIYFFNNILIYFFFIATFLYYYFKFTTYCHI